MSTVRKYQERPNVLVDRAIQAYKSNRKKTIFVEGVNDKAFFKQWTGDNIRYDGFLGKAKIEEIKKYMNSNSKYNIYYNDFLLVADVDYDLTSKLGIVNGIEYFVLDDDRNHVYNDMDIFVLNSSALKKLFSNLRIDIDDCELDELKNKIESATRVFGRYRAADFKLTQGNVDSSILNGLEITRFLDASTLSVDVSELESSIGSWSKSLDIEDLIITAKEIDNEFKFKWALSRGHDATLILSFHLINKYNKKFASQLFVEEKLRIGCEKVELLSIPIGRAVNLFAGIH
ncbi:hypothetical protein D5B78_24675 [Salmonella enterica subsp. enterica serovar Neukoelln]|nr:hypothetical protein [Salmonella enterica subsp. enterica serovar Neukoelln]